MGDSLEMLEGLGAFRNCLSCVNNCESLFFFIFKQSFLLCVVIYQGGAVSNKHGKDDILL